MCQLMIDELGKVVPVKLRRIYVDVNQLRINTTKILDNISVHLDSIKNIMSFVVVSDEVA